MVPEQALPGPRRVQYRSKRAVENQVGSIAGLEMYEAPQEYLDASIEYTLSKYATVFLDGPT